MRSLLDPAPVELKRNSGHAACGTMRSLRDHAATQAMRPAGPCDRFVITRPLKPCGLRDHSIALSSRGHSIPAATQCTRPVRRIFKHAACGTMRSLGDQAATQAMAPAGPCDRFVIRWPVNPCGYSSHAACTTVRSLRDHAATQAMRPAGPCACFVISRPDNLRGHSMHAATQCTRPVRRLFKHAACGTMRSLGDQAATQAMRPAGRAIAS